MLLLTSTYWLLYIVSLLQAITLCLFLPGKASSILFFWLQYQFILIEVVLFRSCGVSFLDSSTRGFIVACGFVIFLCVNMHCILSILEGNSLEESVKNVISSYSFCSTTYCAGSDSDSTSDFQKLAEKGKVYLETVGNATAASAVIGTGLAIGRSPEAAMVAIVRSSPHTKIVIGVGLVVEAAGIALNFFNFVDLLLQYLTTMVVLAKDAVCKSI